MNSKKIVLKVLVAAAITFISTNVFKTLQNTNLVIAAATTSSNINIKMTINNKSVNTAVKPYYNTKSKVAFVPIQNIATHLKYKTTKTGNKITIKAGNKTSVLTLNSNTVKVNNKSYKLKGKVSKKGNYFLVPSDAIKLIFPSGSATYSSINKTVSIKATTKTLSNSSSSTSNTIGGIKTKYGSTYGTRTQAQYDAVMRKIDEFLKSDAAIKNIDELEAKRPMLVKAYRDFYDGKRSKYTKEDFYNFKVEEELGVDNYDALEYEGRLADLSNVDGSNPLDLVLVKHMSFEEYVKLRIAVMMSGDLEDYVGAEIAGKNVEDSAYQLLFNKKTDCGGIAYTGLAVLQASGFTETKYVASSSHAWVEIKIGNKWYEIMGL